MAKHSNTKDRQRTARHLVSTNRLDEARELYLKICRKKPQDQEAWLGLAVVSRKLGALQEAEEASRRALGLHPGPDALHVLGSVLHRQGRINEAITCYRQTLQINPGNVETHYFLANALREQGVIEEAETEYRNTIALQPDHVEALNNLSALLTNRGRIQQAAELLQRALKIQPDSYQMLMNLGRANLHAGDAGKAEAAFRRVIKLQPGLTDAHSNLLACLNYLPARDPHAVFEDHRHWSEVHAGHIQPRTSWPQNEQDLQRRLRVGYVSPDLCEHSVSRFLEPVLARHDRQGFEITCYSDVQHPDATTERLRGLCEHWRETSALSHEQLAGRVRDDGMDILVDLAGHTAHNRLPVFARKPAPLQVTWLGYPNTTGLSSIDFRLTDARADPPGYSDTLNTETLVRLPHSFLCYNAPQNSPATGSPPSQSASHITFGSFNNLAKTTPEVIRTWSRILSRVPGSRLLLKSRATGDPATRQRLLALFSEAGVSAERIGFLDPKPSHYEHLAAYRLIDIALDTFPYHGTTTTCEALWMGIPVITLAGQAHAARVGVSLLTQVGLEDLVAAGESEYLSTAVRLSGDRERLAVLHSSLRETMHHSSLCDTVGFTLELERAYRQMWSDWCQSLDTGN